MSKLISFLICTLCLNASTFAAEPVGILVVGDSWAMLSCKFGSFRKEMSHQGYTNPSSSVRAKIYGCSDTTEGGLKSYHLIEDAYKEKIKDQLHAHPDVKIIYLSAGGNDFSKFWNKNMNESEETAIFEKIRSNLQNAADYIFSLRPDVKILISGYDFPNFKNFIQIKPYKEKFEKLGQPNVLELNSALLRMATYLANQLNKPEGNLKYIHHYGLMHYYFGQPNYGLEERQTTHPQFISAKENPANYGGAIDMETPPAGCMRIGSKYLDAFHLSPDGFRKAFRHSIQIYLADWIEQFAKH